MRRRTFASTWFRRVAGGGAGLLVLALAACDNPVDLSSHSRPVQLVVLESDVVVYDSTAEPQPLALSVGAGAAVRFEFRDRQGRPVDPGTAYYLVLDIPAGAPLTFQPVEPGSFAGMLTATGPTSVTVRVRYMHGRVGRGHSDFDYLLEVVAGGS
jgi:hypothetical protein